MTKACCTAVLVLGALVWAPNAQAQTKKVSYAITDLGAWVSPSNKSPANGINNSGQIVGNSDVTDTTRHACLWERIGGTWTIRDLGASAHYVLSTCTGINELGQVAGYGNTETTTWAFFHDDETGGMELLMPEGHDESSVIMAAINNREQVVGRAHRSDAPTRQACL